MKKILSATLMLGMFSFGVFALAGTVAAQEDAFLCPVVGDGVLNADAHNGDNGVMTLPPAVGPSFSPGMNMAGPNADEHAWNTYGPDNPDAGPGMNPDFSPIWPGDA